MLVSAQRKTQETQKGDGEGQGWAPLTLGRRVRGARFELGTE